MTQDVAISRALESIKTQMGGLTPRMELVISSHLCCMYGVGFNAANRVQKVCKPVLRIDAKGNVKSFPSISDAARSVPTRKQSIINVLKGKFKQCKGYSFQYDIQD